MKLGFENQKTDTFRSSIRLWNVLGASALCYGEPNAISNAIDYAKFRSRSHHAVIRVYDDAGNVIETPQHKGAFREP